MQKRFEKLFFRANFLKVFVVFLVSFGLLLTSSILKPTLAGAIEYDDQPIEFDANKHIPNVDPTVGDGSNLSKNENAIIPIGNLSPKANSALVRVTVSGESSQSRVYSGGLDVLQVSANRTQSNTFLSPIISGGINLYADKEIKARVEVVASFESNLSVAGSIVAIQKPVRRADTMSDLAGQKLSEGIRIGTTGLGGVPTNSVRAIFYTASVTTTVDDSILEIGENKIEIPIKGRVHISNIVVPDVNGNVQAKLYRNSETKAATDGQLTFDVRGYVVDSTPNSTAINSTGSFVPRLTSVPTKLDLKEGEVVEFDTPATSLDSQFAIFAVQTTSQSIDRPTTIDLGEDTYAREQGLSVDGEIGTLPQLIIAKVEGRKSKAIIHHGSASINISHVGDIIGTVSNEASGNSPQIEITSPKDGAKIDYKETGTVLVEGQLKETDISTGVMNIWSDYKGGFKIGSLETHYSQNGVLNFKIDIHPPETGNYVFTVSAQDRSGKEAHSQIQIFVKMNDPEEQGILLWPKTKKIDDGSKYKQINDGDVIMDCDDSIHAGDTLYSQITDKTPQGLIRKVKGVDVVTDGCKYTTDDGDISDVAQNVQLDYDKIDLTNTISDGAVKKLAEQKLKDEDGKDIKDATLENVTLVDEESLKSFKHKDEIAEAKNAKPNKCTPDFQALDSESDCSLRPVLDDYTKSNSPPDSEFAATLEKADPKPSLSPAPSASPSLSSASQSPTPSAKSVAPATPSTSPSKATTSSPHPSGISVAPAKYTPPKVNAFTGEFVNATTSSSTTEGKQALMLTEMALHGKASGKFVAMNSGVKQGSSDGSSGGNNSKVLHFEFKIQANFVVQKGGGADFMLGNGKPYTPKSEKPGGTVPAGDGDEGGDDEADAGDEGGAKTSVTVKMNLTYSKDIKFYVDAGAKFRIWFPSWHFWDIHIDLDTHIAKTTEQTTYLDLDLSITVAFTKKIPLLDLDFPIVEGIISVGFILEVYLKGSITAHGTFHKVTNEYERNGIKTHNFTKTNIDEKRSTDAEKSFSGSITFAFEIGIEFTPNIKFIGFIYIGFAIDLGIKFSISIYSYVPPGTKSAVCEGSFSIDFELGVSFTGGLDFKIFKISFSVNLVNLEINIYKIVFTPNIPTTNIGRFVLNSGISTTDSSSLTELRNQTDDSTFFVTRKRPSGDYWPVNIVNSADISGYSKTTHTNGNGSWAKECEWSSLGFFSGECKGFEEEELEGKTDGKDGMLLIANGNPLPFEEYEKDEELVQKMKEFYSSYSVDFEAAKNLKGAEFFSQLGFVKPDENGNVVLDYLPPGDYRVSIVDSPEKTKAKQSSYDFTINDWLKDSKHNDMNWTGELEKATLGISFVFMPSYSVKSHIKNTSRGQEFSENQGESVQVKTDDIIDINVQVDFPKNENNVGTLMNSKLVLDSSPNPNGKNGDGSIDFSDSTLAKPKLTCTLPDLDSGREKAWTGDDLVNRDGENEVIDLGVEKDTRLSLDVSVDGKLDSTQIGAVGTEFAPGSSCTFEMQGIAKEIGFFAVTPTLVYDLPSPSFSGLAIPERENGSTIEAWGTELTFKTIQKYSNPVVPVSCMEFVLSDSKNAEIEISSVSNDSEKPFAPSGQINNICANSTVPENADTVSSSHIFTTSAHTNLDGSKIEGGLIDIFYLSPGSYKLTQFSAPAHYRQTGIIVEFTIIKPSKERPKAGKNNQGSKEVPPEIVVNAYPTLVSKTHNVYEPNDPLEKYGDATKRDFPPDATGKVNFTGENQNYKGIPGQLANYEWKFEFPACSDQIDENKPPESVQKQPECNVGIIANQFFVHSFDPDDVEISWAEARRFDGYIDRNVYPENSTLIANASNYQGCLPRPQPINPDGTLNHKNNDPGCNWSDTPNTDEVYYTFAHIMYPGNTYRWSFGETLKLDKNQTLPLEVSIDGEDGPPAKGKFDSVQFSRGFGSLFAKERNSLPINDENASLQSGIGIPNVAVELHKQTGESLGTFKTSCGETNDQSTQTSSNEPCSQPENTKFRVVDPATSTLGRTVDFEGLDEGDYYFQIKSVPQNYTADLNEHHNFTVKYQRTETAKARGTADPANPGALLNDFFISNTAFIDYSPKFAVSSKVRNLTRNGESGQQLTDVLIKQNDQIEFSFEINHPDSSGENGETPIQNSAVAYNPKLNLQIPDSVDLSTSSVSVTKSGSSTKSSTLPFSAQIDIGTADADNLHKSTPDEINIGENRTAIMPGDKVNLTFIGTAKTNELGNLVSSITVDYDGKTISALDNVNNISYPGHFEVKVAESWSKGKFISGVPFDLIKDGSDIVNSDLVTNSDGFLAIDYLEAGKYALIPQTHSPLWPEGYILGSNEKDAYSNDVSQNENAWTGDKTKIEFTIDDYKKENAVLNFNAGVFELYYKPQIEAQMSVQNLSRQNSVADEKTIVKANDKVKYHYLATYPSDSQKGLLHSPKLTIRDNSGNNISIDNDQADDLKIKITDQSGKEIQTENPLVLDRETNSISLPDNLEPGFKVDLEMTATVGDIEAGILWVKFEFDHKAKSEKFSDQKACVFRSAVLTTATELHSRGTRFLQDAELSLFKEDGTQIQISKDSKVGTVTSLDATESGNVKSGSQTENTLQKAEISRLQNDVLSDDEKKAIELKQNSMLIEYLDPGNYYFTQNVAPVGYNLSPDEKFKFVIPEFDETKYISFNDEKEIAIPDLIDKDDSLLRVEFVQNDDHTVFFDYSPVLQIETTVRNAAREGSDFSKNVIAKAGDKIKVLVKIKYPSEISDQNVHNRGIVYGAKLIDETHNSKIVHVSKDGGKTFDDGTAWQGSEFEFGTQKGDKETSDNDKLRLLPDDEIYLIFDEDYQEDEVIQYRERVSHLFEKPEVKLRSDTANSSVSFVYFGKVTLQTFVADSSGTKTPLGGVIFDIFNGKNEKIGTSSTNENSVAQFQRVEPGSYVLKLSELPHRNLIEKEVQIQVLMPDLFDKGGSLINDREIKTDPIIFESREIPTPNPTSSPSSNPQNSNSESGSTDDLGKPDSQNSTTPNNPLENPSGNSPADQNASSNSSLSPFEIALKYWPLFMLLILALIALSIFALNRKRLSSRKNNNNQKGEQ